MKSTGAFRERLHEAWIELKENPGRSLLQALGVMLGVASVLGGGAMPTAKGVNATSFLKEARARVRSEAADQERAVSGIGADYVAMNGYEIEQGRDFSAHDFASGAPVAILGSEAARVFFPTGEVVGRPLRLGDTRVTVIGVFSERTFRFRKGQNNIFAWRNRIVAAPGEDVVLPLA